MKYPLFFFLYFIFPANLFATDNDSTTQREYPVPGHGELVLNVPVNWEDRTYLKIPRVPRCCTNRSQARREAQVIAVAIAKPINADCGRLVHNSQGRVVRGTSPRRSSLIWNNQISFLASCAASANTAVATVRNLEIGSGYLSLAEDKPPVITFYQTDRQKREIFQLNLSIFWDDGFKRDITKPENIKTLVTNVGKTILESSADSELILNQITGTGGQGYYFKLSDKVEKSGEYKYLTQGALNIGELLLVFSLFTYEPDIQLQNMALIMLQTAMHKFQRHI